MKIDIEAVKQFIAEQSTETKIYFGADSERVLVGGKYVVDYLLVIAVHIDGKHGAKVFGEIQRDAHYDKNLGKPKLRLMNEVYRISELFLQFKDFLEDRHVEIHLDIASLPIYGSNVAMSEAIGYVKGVCGVDPVIKPDAWAASICADKIPRLNKPAKPFPKETK